MKRKSLLSVLTLLFVFTISSCKEDEHRDWGVLNEQWITNPNLNTTIDGWKPEDRWVLNNIKEIQTLENGLKYSVIHQGSGRRPNKTSSVTITYTELLIDGTVISTFTNVYGSLSYQTQGFIEGVAHMNAGGRYILYVPSYLGYGDDGSGNIPPHSTLIYDVQLHDDQY